MVVPAGRYFRQLGSVPLNISTILLVGTTPSSTEVRFEQFWKAYLKLFTLVNFSKFVMLVNAVHPSKV